MQSTEIVDIELTSPGGPPPVVHAVAGDIYSRFVEMHLFAAGVPFEPPDGTTCIIGWRRTDTDYGAYNSIMEDDGKTSHEAYSFDGSVLTIELDWHVCQKAGNVAVNVSMNGEGGSRLHTWELICRVARGAVADAEDPTKPSESATDAANRAEAAANRAEAAANRAEAALGQVDGKIDAAVQGVTDEAKQAANRAEAAAKRSEAVADELENIVKDGPVVSVNGKTGRVQLSASDIPFDNAGTPFVSTTVQDAIEELLSIGGGGGAAISTITVTAPAGAVVTISQGAKKYTQTVGPDGATLSFKVLETGEWSVVATLDEQQDSGSVTVSEAGGSYSITLDFAPYRAYIKVTAPDGATVKATKGDKSVSGVASGGSVTLTVNEGGEWTITATYKDGIAQTATVNVLEEGETYTAEAKFCTLTVTAPAGSTVEIKNGDSTLTGTADSGSVKFWLPNTGTWTTKATLNGQTATGSVDCSAYEDYSVELSYFSATLTATAVAGATVTATCGETVVTGQAAGNGQAALEIKLPGNYVVQATMANSYGNATSNSQAVNVVDNGGSYTATVKFIRLTVTIDAGSQITISKGDTNISLTGTGSDQVYLPSTGTWTVSASLDDQSTSESVECNGYQDYSVELSYISDVLTDNSWEVIKQVADADEGANWWSVGDTKQITINGRIVNLQVNELEIDTFILSFNHNSSKEGAHLIHFAIGKISGKMVALCDNQYDSYNGSGFVMNQSDTNDGGWRDSYMRSTVLGSTGNPASPQGNTLLAALPADLRAVLQKVSKYTDNVGGTNSSGSVSATEDYLWLLSEYEVQGDTPYGNDYEKNSQQQYDYFKTGNSKIAYKHTSPGSAVWWWLRSPRTHGNYFCRVHTDGSAYYFIAYSGGGLLAGFAA